MGRKKTDISGVFEKNPGTGIWYIRYRTGGKSVRKRIGTRAAAVECLNKVRLISVTGNSLRTGPLQLPNRSLLWSRRNIPCLRDFAELRKRRRHGRDRSFKFHRLSPHPPRQRLPSNNPIKTAPRNFPATLSFVRGAALIES